jgi:SAM-dependent methyltransferase
MEIDLPRPAEISFRTSLPRRDQLLLGIDVSASTGAEVGPLDRASVAKTDGAVYYIDHCDTEALRARWASDPNVDVSKLHVDAVWGQRTLQGALKATTDFSARCPHGLDYVVASHVIEHVPDLVAWLNEIAEVLRSSGSLRLAIPDRRYTFDINRRETVLGEVLEAHVRKRRAPSASRILDFALNMVTVDLLAAWRGDLNVSLLQRQYTDADAISLAYDAEHNGAYHDVHCWVFTPISFVELMLSLARCNLLSFACDWIATTAPNTFEFFVSMRPERVPEHVLTSWTQWLDRLRPSPASTV